MDDRHRLRSTIIVGVAGSAVIIFLYTFVYGWYSQTGWWLPSDAVMDMKAGMFLLHGHLTQVYSNKNLYELPLTLPFTGLVTQIDYWLKWPGRDFLLWVDCCYLALSLPLIYLVRSLAWDLGLRRRLVLVQVVVMALAAAPVAQWGHPEDLIGLIFVVQALRYLIRSQVFMAAFFVSLAIASKQWAMMLVPMVVIATPPGRRWRSFFICAALPIVLASVFLAVDFQEAFKAFASPVPQVVGFPGHPWFDGTWAGSHSSQINRLAAVVLAVAITWYLRHRLADPVTIVTIAAVILAIRPLTETINYSYYWSPTFVLASVVSVVAAPARRYLTWAPILAADLWTFPRSNDGTALIWWVGELVLLWLAARQLPLSRARVADSEPTRQPLLVGGL